MTEPHYWSLCAMAEAIRSGACSAVEATEHQLARIERLEPALRSFATVTREAALARAAALDRERARGLPCGPLHGVPLAVKDLLATRGVPTSCGTRILAGWTPEYDATVVARLQRAGAVPLGKLQLTEGAFSAHHPDVTPPRNPWAAEHWSGVSSSGSGVATAAGLCFASLGTDTGGSIRFPSAANGLVGVKPTYGRVSRYGAFPLAESLDHVGPMTRTVRDAARMLGVLAGHDVEDETSLRQPVPDYEAGLEAGVTGLRVGIDRDYAERGVAPEVAGAVADACTLLEDNGAVIRSVQVPPWLELVEGWAVTTGVEAALAHASWFPERQLDYGPELTALLELGRRSSAVRYAGLERARQRFRAGLDTLLREDIDVLLAPAMPTPPPALAMMGGGDDPDTADFLTFTAPFDYSGHPTVTLPSGVTQEGLPLAIQFVGAPLSEGTLLRVAQRYEQTRDSHSRHPLP